jgi:hypothetical protein
MNKQEEALNCLKILLGERDMFLPVIYSVTKISCIHSNTKCPKFEPDQSNWCIFCKARNAYQFADAENFYKAQQLIDESELWKKLK